MITFVLFVVFSLENILPFVKEKGEGDGVGEGNDGEGGGGGSGGVLIWACLLMLYCVNCVLSI